MLATIAANEGATTIAKWGALVAKLKEVIPKTPFTERDRLHKMKWRACRNWQDFLDRYSLFVDTCTGVTDKEKALELYKKLPKDVR